MKAIRWLGAFRKESGSLIDSFIFELTQTQREEVAAEAIDKKSLIEQARVGLLVKRSAIVKVFSADCWSEYSNKKLYKTRNPRLATGDHREIWCRPDYVAIVVKDWDHLKKRVKQPVRYIADRFELPILELKKGGLRPVD